MWKKKNKSGVMYKEVVMVYFTDYIPGMGD
jgi:hypothetical protein